MGQKLPPKQLLLYKKINDLLLRDWDPCCVYGVPEARDEYFSYLPHVFKLATEGANPEKIANYLLSVEKEQMGCKGDKKLCMRIANIIVNEKEALGL